MPTLHPGNSPIAPDERQYDVRVGASSYAPIVGAMGSLAVTAIVVVFTVPQGVSKTSIAFAAGLLAIGFFGSLLGSFALAAIGAERDPTVNLAAAILFTCVPVILGIVAILGAFSVLASIYIPESAGLFRGITAAGGAFGVVFSVFSIADSVGLHPTTMSPKNFEDWLSRQWIKSRSQGLRASNLVLAVCLLPLVIVGVMRFIFDVSIPLNATAVNWVIGGGILVSLVGTWLGLMKTTHPKIGNDQRALKPFEAWAPNAIISLYVCALVLTLP